MVKEINLFEQEFMDEQKLMDEPELELEACEDQTHVNNQFARGIEPLSAAAVHLKRLQEAEAVKAQEKMTLQHAKRIIEALLFVSSDPLPFVKIREILDTFQPLKPKVIRDLLTELQEEYLMQQRAFRLEEIANGFLLRTCEEYGPFIDALYRNKRKEKLSQAAAEVLAIIAYRQPITRPQMEAIRGVDCSGIVQNLLDRQLIEVQGKLEAPGRPTLYGITQDFLKHFGLRDVQELPSVSQ